jgi:hypothetical protein
MGSSWLSNGSLKKGRAPVADSAESELDLEMKCSRITEYETFADVRGDSHVEKYKDHSIEAFLN